MNEVLKKLIEWCQKEILNARTDYCESEEDYGRNQGKESALEDVIYQANTFQEIHDKNKSLRENGLIVGWYKSTPTNQATNNHVIRLDDSSRKPICGKKIASPILRFQESPMGRIDCRRCDKLAEI